MARLSASPLDGVDVHWVTRGERALYSGMVSGWVAGEDPRDVCMVQLAPLATPGEAQTALSVWDSVLFPVARSYSTAAPTLGTPRHC